MEDDDVINTVEEFWPEVSLELFAHFALHSFVVA